MLLAASLMVCGSAGSHPARSITARYEQDGALTVEVIHPVNDPAKHYIERISIYKDGALVAQEEYRAQESENVVSRAFQIGTCAPGTRIMIEASCVIMGSASCEITI